MRIFFLACYLFISAVFLAGCSDSADGITETTLIVARDGGVSEAIIEDFDKDYYLRSDLESFIDQRINEFNASGSEGKKVSLDRLTVENRKALAVVDFDSIETYADFSGNEAFFGTISEAYDAGYSFDVTLKSTTESETIGKEEIMEMDDKHILVISEPISVRSSRRILYASANVDVKDTNNVSVSSESVGLAYMILK